MIRLFISFARIFFYLRLYGPDKMYQKCVSPLVYVTSHKNGMTWWVTI